MAYTAPTLAQAQAALAERLYDPLFVRWTAAELARYLREALRTWNAWTSHFRDQGAFTGVMGEAFYHLGTELPTLCAQTVSNWDLVTDIQYALLEPPTPSAWSGTDQFDLAEVSAAIQRRRDQFLRETGAVLTRSLTLYDPVPGSGRLPLDETIVTVRRAAWRPVATQTLLPLMRTDEWGANNFATAWLQQTGTPRGYSVTDTPPLEMQLIPKASAAGTLDMVSVNRGPAITPGVETALGVPNDWSWVIKYGALSDLLNGDGLALDPHRGAYCEGRWQQGLDMASKFSTVLSAQINGVTARIGSLADADKYSPVWQLLGGVPRVLLLAGQNLVASWPPPGGTGGPFTFTLDVVRNAPVPVNPGDILQVGQDVYDSILDIAQHTAVFKEGPGELEAAGALIERAARHAGITLRLQQADQPSREPLLTQTRTDEHALPRQLDAVPVE